MCTIATTNIQSSPIQVYQSSTHQYQTGKGWVAHAGILFLNAHKTITISFHVIIYITYAVM